MLVLRPPRKKARHMTNASVETTVAGIKGPEFTLKYKDGEKKFIGYCKVAFPIWDGGHAFSDISHCCYTVILLIAVGFCILGT